jgi:hypothetical protein
MNTLIMAVLLGTVALLGNLTVDWLRHSKPEPIELIGTLVIGMVLALGFRKKATEVVNLEDKNVK